MTARARLAGPDLRDLSFVYCWQEGRDSCIFNCASSLGSLRSPQRSCGHFIAQIGVSPK